MKAYQTVLERRQKFEMLCHLARTVKYDADSVQKAIDRDKTIGTQEAKLIHSILKGWRKE